MKSLQAFTLLLLTSTVFGDTPCQRLDLGESSFVCSCNSSYCDESDPVGQQPRGQAVLVSSNRLTHRFAKTPLEFQSSPNGSRASVEITVDKSMTFQTVFGWGGAFTDATGINIAKLSSTVQNELIRSYFDPTGLDYNIGRINMGGCDFSPRPYSYVDTPGDVTLATFALQEEDLVYKIPFIKKAQSYKQEPLKLYASPWTAPKWMKSNNDFIGQGFLLPEYYQPWAEYFLRFLQEYEKEGVVLWGVTTQNEPEDGNVPEFPFNSMGWNATTQRTFVVDHLGPTLEGAGFDDIKIMILDDQRILAPKWAEEVLSDPAAFLYVDGIAIHWYTDNIVDLPHALDMVHDSFPDKFMLYSEACNGFGPVNDNSVLLGDWKRGEDYFANIIQDLNHWVVGWTDWNLALDMLGGPNWAEYAADAAIIVNEATDEFYKQPMYYALGHISKYLIRDSVRIGTIPPGDDDLNYVAVLRPNNDVAIAILNRRAEERSVQLHDPDLGYLDLLLPPESINTIIYGL